MPISELMPQRLGNFLGIVETETVTRGANGYRQCFYGSDRSRCDGETFDSNLFFNVRTHGGDSSFEGASASTQECARRLATDGVLAPGTDVADYVDRAVGIYGPYRVENIAVGDRGADCRIVWDDVESQGAAFDSESARVVLDTGLRLIYEWLDRSVEVTKTTGIYEIVELLKTGVLVAFGVGVVVAGMLLARAVLYYVSGQARQDRVGREAAAKLEARRENDREEAREHYWERKGLGAEYRAARRAGYKTPRVSGGGGGGRRARYFARKSGGAIEKKVIDGKRYFKGRDGKWRVSRY